jgi:hypothetical protein
MMIELVPVASIDEDWFIFFFFLLNRSNWRFKILSISIYGLCYLFGGGLCVSDNLCLRYVSMIAGELFAFVTYVRHVLNMDSSMSRIMESRKN